ncbi:DNA -binding domain-containing protein [Bradyrhizobium denitrificans]
MLVVTAAPSGFAASLLPDSRALPILSELTGDGLHAVAADSEGDHQLWFAGGGEAVHAAILLPIDPNFWWRYRNAGRLVRRLEGQRAGRWPRDQRLSAFQLHRAALMLRAWDGVESGASRRTVASVLLNQNLATLRALDWKNAPERRRLARILIASRDTIEGGYLRWLAPRNPQR